MDLLIAQYDRDMDQNKPSYKVFKRVLQSLKDGTLSVDDAFIRRDSHGDGGKKCNKDYEWGKPSSIAPSKTGQGRPTTWQTFLIRIVSNVPGNHIPYFKYAKANNADFKIWDMFGGSLLHLILERDPIDPNAEEDLKWLL